MIDIGKRILQQKPARYVVLMTAIIGIWCGWSIHFNRPEPMSQHPKPEAVICIDPGHPSPVASGFNDQNGVTEAEMNWDVAKKLAAILSDDERIQVVMTRSVENQVMSNPDRAIIANKAAANLAIHLHCDAGPDHGFTVYYPNREGKAEGKTGPSKEIIGASSEAAESVHTAMQKKLDGVLHDRGIRGESCTRVGRMNGALTVSIWSEVPSVTVEMVFLSNEKDADFIKSEWGQQKMATALADGIMDYLYTTKTLKKLPAKQILDLDDPRPS